MGSFKEYFIGLFAVCAVCTLCDLLSDFASKGISRALRMICSLALFLTVFSAVFKGCDANASLGALQGALNNENALQTAALSDEIFIENTRLELEKNVSSAIYEKFGIKPDGISIEFSTEKKDGITEISVKSVKVALPQSVDESVLSAADSFADGLFGVNADISRNRSS